MIVYVLQAGLTIVRRWLTLRNWRLARRTAAPANETDTGRRRAIALAVLDPGHAADDGAGCLAMCDASPSAGGRLGNLALAAGRRRRHGRGDGYRGVGRFGQSPPVGLCASLRNRVSHRR